MMDEILLKNYHIALEQKYNAICFDIDGTLTEKNSEKINKDIIYNLSILLKRRIPIVFITGRGETGINDLLNEIIPDLKEKYGISDNMLLNMYALLNDGARLFSTKNNNKNFKIFNNSEFISSPKSLSDLSYFNQKIIYTLSELIKSKKLSISYSKDFNTGIILNVRICLNIKDNILENLVIEMVNELLKKENLDTLNVTKGMHGGRKIIQIGTAIKSDAISKVESIIGIPKDSMLRIGDCGDILGNDFSMLDCPQGFSVDKTSGKNNACFPIIDKNGNILKGVAATKYIIENAKILPTICLENANEQNYRKNYALVERKIDIGRKKHLSEFNKLINELFKTYDGINSIFDKETGSIKFLDYEWELIDDNNPLKQLWKTRYDNSLLYSLKDNYGYLLRGSKTYYYFLANRVLDEYNKNNEDLTTKDVVLDWFDNYYDFFKKTVIAINQLDNINELCNKRMILAILDNIRNYLLISINQQLFSNYENKIVMINMENLRNMKSIKKFYEILLRNELLMKKICFEKNVILNKDEIIKLIIDTIKLLKEHKFKFNNSQEKENYSKEFRAYREIDNFAENYITVELSKRKINVNSKKIGVCGMCYGGIELPVLFKIIDNDIEDISLLKLNKIASGYAKKQSFELRLFDVKDFGGIKLYGVDKSKKYLLADDNLLTGKTMQLAMNSMYDIGIDISGLSIVRYPSVNRINQMFMPNHGAVDYNMFFDYINGLCFPSPYSWKDPNSTNKYKDSLDVFDINRRKIIECLLKNGDYKEKSEVYKLKAK